MNRKLTLEELEYVRNETKQKRKSVEVTYVLAIFLGYLGVHLGYMEKRKSAVVRALLSISTLILLFLANTTVEILWSTELTMRLQQYGSALTVVMSGLLIIQLIWIIYDFVSIPKGIKKINKSIEDDASTAVIQSRYAAEAVRKEETSKFVIDEVTKNVNSKFENEIHNQVELANDKINSIANALNENHGSVRAMESKMNVEIESLYENIEKKLQETKDNLNEKVTGLNQVAKNYKELEVKCSEIRFTLESQSMSIEEKLEVEAELMNLISELNEVVFAHSVSLDLNARMNELENNLKTGLELLNSADSAIPRTEPTNSTNAVNDSININKEASPASASELSPQDGAGLQSEPSPQDTAETHTDDSIVVEVKNEEGAELTEASEWAEEGIFPITNTNVVMDEDSDKKTAEVHLEPTEGDLVSEFTDYNSSDSMSVRDAIEKQGVVTVTGYIVGEMSHGETLLRSNFNSNSNIVISDSMNLDDTDTLTVQLLGKSSLRQLYGLKGNPEALGTKITVIGKREKYFNGHGLKRVEDIKAD